MSLDFNMSSKIAVPLNSRVSFLEMGDDEPISITIKPVHCTALEGSMGHTASASNAFVPFDEQEHTKPFSALSNFDIHSLAKRLQNDLKLRERAAVSEFDDSSVIAIKLLLQHMEDVYDAQRKVLGSFLDCLTVLLPHCTDISSRARASALLATISKHDPNNIQFRKTVTGTSPIIDQAGIKVTVGARTAEHHRVFCNVLDCISSRETACRAKQTENPPRRIDFDIMPPPGDLKLLRNLVEIHDDEDLSLAVLGARIVELGSIDCVNRITCVTCMTGDMVVTGNSVGAVKAWSTQHLSITPLFEWLQHHGAVRCLTSRDVEVFSCGEDGATYRYELIQGTCIGLICSVHHSSIGCCSVNASTLVTGTSSGSLHIWTYRNAVWQSELRTHVANVIYVQFISDDSAVVISCDGFHIVLTDVTERVELRKITVPIPNVTHMAYDCGLIAMVDRNLRIAILDLSTEQTQTHQGVSSAVDVTQLATSTLRIAKDHILTVTTDGILRMWSINSGAFVLSFRVGLQGAQALDTHAHLMAVADGETLRIFSTT